ncbi:MAG: hypothetical protein JXR96_19920 [Deltaproteobacteria bacterium]|nr:hypothetical protein [Deltaproteobacteria bacterium]
MQELDRLEEEADESHFDGRHHRLTFGPEAVRKVQLYRSLAHEVGHLVHYQREVDIPAKMDSEDLELWERLHDAFFCRAQREREDFAHRYSVTWRRRLVEQGIIPFDRQADAEAMRAEGLDPSDFGSS